MPMEAMDTHEAHEAPSEGRKGRECLLPILAPGEALPEPLWAALDALSENTLTWGIRIGDYLYVEDDEDNWKGLICVSDLERAHNAGVTSYTDLWEYWLDPVDVELLTHPDLYEFGAPDVELTLAVLRGENLVCDDSDDMVDAICAYVANEVSFWLSDEGKTTLREA